MFVSQEKKQQKYEFITIEQLVPEDHLLRQIDKYIDFTFITDITKDLYCKNNGRPCIDPIILFKMLFIGYLYGIRSERQLVKDIEVNVAYRWFLGYSLTDKIAHHSTISQNRRRKYRDANIAEQIFDEIVRQAISHNLVSGKVLYTDSTHIKANANKRNLESKEYLKEPKSYLEELDEAVTKEREKHGKKPLKKKEHKPEIKEKKVSTTDPDSGYMFRDRKPKGFFYLDHRTVDIKYNIITDVTVTAGNVNDVDPYLNILDKQIEKFDFETKYVGLDAGYYTNYICKELAHRDIQGAIAYRLGPHIKYKYTKNKFNYISEKDIYTCPAGQVLNYRTTTRIGYSEYVCSKEICQNCSLKQKCLSEKASFRTIRRHVWEHHKEDVREFMKTEKGKGIYKKRKETVERSFADGKNLHGLRYCHMRGKKNVEEQCLLTAAVQNMKKITRVLNYREKNSILLNSGKNIKFSLFSKSILTKISYRKTLTNFLVGVFHQSEINTYIYKYLFFYGYT
jgi:transposase